MTRDEVRSFDELTTQLCMYGRNFARSSGSLRGNEEALTVKAEVNQSQWKSKRRSRKEDTCNYSKKKGHWVKDCRKWQADGKSGTRKVDGNNQGETKALI